MLLQFQFFLPPLQQLLFLILNTAAAVAATTTAELSERASDRERERERERDRDRDRERERDRERQRETETERFSFHDRHRITCVLFLTGDYSANHCNSAHCVPCQMYWASCQDLDDGLHPWEKGEGHVHWVDCRDGRNVGQGRCDSQNGVPYVFSQQSLSCVRYDGQFTLGYS